MKKKILCYGHYNHQNLGDELFKNAFEKLFPEYDFTFTDHLTIELLKDKDALFFGGGSFLNQSISGFNVWDFQGFNTPVFYIGVGFETEIHIDHYHFLGKAKLITSRSGNCRWLNVAQKQWNITLIPDLVYYLKLKSHSFKKENTVLILPNVSVIPKYDSPSWVTSAWDNFKNQFAQFLDYLIDNEFNIKFGTMCHNEVENDNYASYQISSLMKHRSIIHLENDHESDQFRANDIGAYSHVITQRYHGIVLSEIMNIPVLPISHHDKLNVTGALPYYEISKHRLINSFYRLKEPNISIDFSAFEELKKRVNDILNA